MLASGNLSEARLSQVAAEAVVCTRARPPARRVVDKNRIAIFPCSI
jgi:hypothetical protein